MTDDLAKYQIDQLGGEPQLQKEFETQTTGYADLGMSHVMETTFVDFVDRTFSAIFSTFGK